MPQPRSHLPSPLQQHPFSVESGHDHGLSRGTLRHPRFARPYYGVRALAEPRTNDSDRDRTRDRDRFPAQRARAAARDFIPRLRPGEAFSHTTALYFFGCPIHAGTELHVVISRPASRAKTAGVVGHTHQGAVPHWGDNATGAPVVPPVLALAQAASLLPFRELVVAIDHLIRDRNGRSLSSIAELEVVTRAARSRGARRARAALELSRMGAESRMETLLRLVLAAYGIDVFELQVDLRDEHGEWIGRFDMVDHARKIIVEYDGEQHRLSDAQYERDAIRLARARDAGYLVLRFRRRDVLDTPEQTAARIARALGVPLRLARGPLASYLAER